MKQMHRFFTDKVKLGKKGQITLPKIIRDEDGLAEGASFIVTHMPGGDIVLRRTVEIAPEDLMLEAMRRAPRFNWREAWKEVKRERLRERS